MFMEPSVALQDLSFLIVDDSRFARIFIRNALATYGLRHTLEAPDAHKGLEILTSEKVDVVLVDQEMPRMCGVAFTRAVRWRRVPVPDSEIPIIMISGCTDERSVVAARNAGIHEFVVKPVSPARLFERVRHTLENPRPFIRTEKYVGPCRRWRARTDAAPLPAAALAGAAHP